MGKVTQFYSLSLSVKNTLRFALAVIALGLLLLFGLLFVVVIGGTTGWAGFAIVCFAIFIIGDVGIISIK